MWLVLFVLKSLLGIARQWSREKFVTFVAESCKNFNISDVEHFYLVYKSKMATTRTLSARVSANKSTLRMIHFGGISVSFLN